MKSFKDFVAEKKKISKYGAEYTSKSFFVHCLYGAEFRLWLETMRDQKLTQSDCVKIARAYIQYWDNEPYRMPGILQSLAKEYHAELPPVYGILTADYWQTRSEKWIKHTA